MAANEQAAPALLAGYQSEFRNHASGGGSWPPLSPRTVARKKQNANMILVETGQFLASLNYTRAFKKSINIGFARGNSRSKKLFRIHSEGVFVPVRFPLPAPLGQSGLVNYLRSIYARNILNLFSGG
jgi:hypothetical protein